MDPSPPTFPASAHARPSPDGLRYVLYARKSSESEDRQVQSIDDQLRVLRQVAAQRSLFVVEELTETRSAKAEGTRPVFEGMLQTFREGRADAVLCWSVNRLTRNPEDSGRLAGLLQRGQIRAIQTPDRRYLPDDNALILAVDTGVANQFILDLRKNTMRGMAAKVERGWFPHKAPEGYVNDRHLDQGERTISADPERFPLVQQAFGLLLSGEYSVGRALAVLNGEWGYRTRPSRHRPSRPLPRTTFYAMTHSLFYAGHFLEGGTLHKGSHPAMLTLDEYHRLQAVVGRERPPRRGRHSWAYTGLITCAHCGGAVTAELKTKPSGRTYRYYHCHGDQGRLPCKRRHVREEALEAQINEQLERVTIDAETARLAREAVTAWKDGQLAQRRAVHGAQQRALSDVQGRLNALLDTRLAGLLSNEEYAAKKRELSAEQARLREDLDRTEAVSEEVRETTLNTIDFHEHARSLFASGDVALRRAITRLLGASYTLEDGRLRVEVSPVLQPILRAGLGQGLEGFPRGEGDLAAGTGAGSGAADAVAGDERTKKAAFTLTSRTVEVGPGSGEMRLSRSVVRFGSAGRTLAELRELFFPILDGIAKAARESGARMAAFGDQSPSAS